MMSVLTTCSQRQEPLKYIHVLIIYSYGENEMVVNSTNSLLMNAMLKRGYKVSVDCLRIGPEQKGVDRAKRLRQRLDEFEILNPDIVITEGEEATTCYLETGHKLVNTRPILFANAFWNFADEMQRHHNMRGVLYRPDYNRNIKLVKRLFGNRVIELMVNESTIGRIILDYIDGAVDKRQYNISWQAVTRDSVRGISYNREGDSRNVQGSALTRQDLYFVSYGDMTSDDVMFHFSPDRMRRRVLLNAGFSTFSLGLCCMIPCPVVNVTFSGFASDMNVVGGYFAHPTEIAERLSDQIIAIMNHNALFPKVVNCKPTYNFDYKQLQRWNIALSDLPEGSNVINLPFSIKYKYVYILIVVVVVVVLLVLIMMTVVGIWASIKRKQRAVTLAGINSKYLLSIGGGQACTWWFSSADGMFHFDERISEISGQDKKVYTSEEIMRIVHPEDRHFFDYFKGNSMFETVNNSFEFRSNISGDGYRWYRVLFSSRKQNDESFIYGGIILDIQDSKDSERELEEAIGRVKSSDIKQSFLANMSHEIKTPLNAVVGFSNLLSDSNFADAITPEERQEYMQLINSNSKLLQNIIDSILEISSLETGGLQFVMKTYPIEMLTREIFNSYNIVVRKDVEFLYEPTDVEVEINVDKLRFMQVFDNLLSNSNKFTQRGYIKFGSEYLEATSEVRFFVEDTGKGISKENQTKIFERFYKVDESDVGTGLGLPLCKLITEKMGGRISVASELGKGSRFDVVFPCRKGGGE